MTVSVADPVVDGIRVAAPPSPRRYPSLDR